jgi:hypothetical protein
MLITSAPIVIPVNTANVPTESVAAEAAQRPKIPQPPSASEGSRSKNSTEFNEQPKSTLPLDNSSDQNQTVEDKNGSQQQNSQSSNQQQSEQQLEAEELAQVQKLRNRDREVKAHEQAHASVGGTLAGAPNLNYTTGPDGKRYAVSGDVSIDISKVPNDPEATIRKLEQVQRAALAPANPSAQDAKVAAVAAAAINQARAELNVERLEQAEQEKQARSEALEETQNFSEPNEINSQLLASDVDRSSAIDDVTSNNQSQAVLNSNAQAADLLGLNPVQARRQAAQLNQRIAGSGALDVNENPSRSFRV